MREPKIVELTVAERIGVVQLLPVKAGFSNMKLIRELREALVLTSEESDAVEFTEDAANGTIRWDAEKAKTVVGKIPFDTKMLCIVIDALEKLEEAEGLELRHMSLYEKFVLVKTDDEKVEVGKVVGAI